MCIQLVILWSVDNLPFHQSHSVPLILPGMFEFVSNRIMSCSSCRPVWEQRNAPNKPTRGRPHWTLWNYRDRLKENSWLLYFMRHHVVRERVCVNFLILLWGWTVSDSVDWDKPIPKHRASPRREIPMHNCWCKWFLWHPCVEERMQCAVLDGGFVRKHSVFEYKLNEATFEQQLSNCYMGRKDFPTFDHLCTKEKQEKGVLTLKHLNCLPSLWRKSGSGPSSTWISEPSCHPSIERKLTFLTTQSVCQSSFSLEQDHEIPPLLQLGR